MKTILLLTCGTNACFRVAKVLKENYSDRIRIVGADINPRWSKRPKMTYCRD